MVSCSRSTRRAGFYDRPVNVFVAGFIGSPAMNIKTVPLTESGARFAEMILPLSREQVEAARTDGSTLVPPGTVIPDEAVLVGRPPHVIRSATDADRERLAVLRQHQTNLTDYPGTILRGPMRAGERMGTLYDYRGKTPSIGAGTLLFDSAEITGDVVIGEDSLIGAGVKIIGDSHGPVRIGSRVQILENTVLHLLPDNELVIDDDAMIGPGAMIHGCHIGRGSIVEPGAIVCDGSVVGAESVVRAGACLKPRGRRPIARRLWTDTWYLLSGFPLAVASFVIVVSGVATGVAGMILVGPPVLAATLLAAGWFADRERRRIAPVLGMRLTAPAYRVAPPDSGVLRLMLNPITDPRRWQDALHAALVPVVSMT